MKYFYIILLLLLGSFPNIFGQSSCIENFESYYGIMNQNENHAFWGGSPAKYGVFKYSLLLGNQAVDVNPDGSSAPSCDVCYGDNYFTGILTNTNAGLMITGYYTKDYYAKIEMEDGSSFTLNSFSAENFSGYNSTYTVTAFNSRGEIISSQNFTAEMNAPQTVTFNSSIWKNIKWLLINDAGLTGDVSLVLDNINYTPSVTFVGGSDFIQSITPNSNNQVLGRFKLTGSSDGIILTSASIKLNNVRTGLSNFKLWSSTDASFGGDTQLGSTVALDPGNGNSVTFGSISSTISTNGTYYFLTADVSSSATGTVQGVIVQNSSFTINTGTMSGTISNAVISNETTPLPVEFTSFTAKERKGEIVLNWSTATELNNYGFEVQRLDVRNLPSPVDQNSEVENWIKIGFVQGSGNSNSAKVYTFIDANPFREDLITGKVQYRLKQIDNDGVYKYSPIVEASIDKSAAFSLKQNYPNPFNPITSIKYSIPESANNELVLLKVYDMLGKEVATLINKQQPAGNYEVKFDASKLANGIYVYKLTAGSFTSTKKMNLLK